MRIRIRIKIESIDVVGGRCMTGNGGTLFLNDEDSAKLWKEHIS